MPSRSLELSWHSLVRGRGYSWQELVLPNGLQSVYVAPKVPPSSDWIQLCNFLPVLKTEATATKDGACLDNYLARYLARRGPCERRLQLQRGGLIAVETHFDAVSCLLGTTLQ
jgi:hypothetical protein